MSAQDKPLGDLIEEWVAEAHSKKPYGCSHPIASYVASKAYEHGKSAGAPKVVAVTDRLPKAGDCLGRPTESSDAGWCWLFHKCRWLFVPVVYPHPFFSEPIIRMPVGVTHWARHDAFPLPTAEEVG